MGFLEKLGLSKPKKVETPKAVAPKDLAPVGEVRQQLMDKKASLLKEIADFKKNDFGGDIKKEIKRLQGEVDRIDEQLVATLSTPESMLAERQVASAEDLLDKRQVEKPEFMKAKEAQEAAQAEERKALQVEQRSLSKEKIALLTTIDEAERQAHAYIKNIDDDRFGFNGPKKVGSLGEAGLDVEQARIAETKKRLAEVYARLSDIEEKLG
jgi:hypothetical protein